MFGNWANAAMALYRLQGIDARLQAAIKRANEVFVVLNKLPGIKINPLPSGTNIYSLGLSKEIDGKKMQEILHKKYNIEISPLNNNNHGHQSHKSR